MRIKDLKSIDLETHEGRLLMAALAVITTECRTDKTPDEVINELNERADYMFRHEPEIETPKD
jgi:hypothetical protein